MMGSEATKDTAGDTGRTPPRAGAGPRAQDATEAYWAQHERMRRDYLADLEAAYEVYLAAKAQHAPGSPALAHVEKLAGIRPILPRLQVRREQAEQARGGPAAQALLPERTVAFVLGPLCRACMSHWEAAYSNVP